MFIDETIAIAISPISIDNMPIFIISFYYASHKLKSYLSDPTSNASVMRKMLEPLDEQLFAPAYCSS